MKKKLLFIIAMVSLLACLFAISVGAVETDPNADYYDKVYVDSHGKSLPLYEKVADTYYPLVWFAYENADEETVYVSVHFEDVTTLSHAANQGRLNGLSYSKFMFGLKKAGIDLNRKVLAEIAVSDATAFTALCEKAKANV